MVLPPSRIADWIIRTTDIVSDVGCFQICPNVTSEKVTALEGFVWNCHVFEIFSSDHQHVKVYPVKYWTSTTPSGFQRNVLINIVWTVMKCGAGRFVIEA